MKTFSKTPLALAIAALVASPYALAEEGYNYNDFDTDSEIDSEMENDIEADLEHNADTDKYINVFLNAYVDPDNYSGATVDSKQLTNGNDVDNVLSENNASVDDSALRGASGNIGVNNAAGDNNQQANDAALAASDAATVFGQSTAVSAQSAAGNNVSNNGSTNNASLGGNAMRNVTGNIGANVTAGVANGQQNSLSASVNTASGSADATTAGVQSTAGNYTSNSGDKVTLTSTSKSVAGLFMTGTYSGGGSGTYDGGWEQTNDVYPEIWLGNGEDGHPSGENNVGHLDFDGEPQASENSQFAGDEGGELSFEESGTIELSGVAAGYSKNTREILVYSENNASLDGNALRGASGNIGVNVSAGSNNLQRNSLSIAASTGGSSGGGSGE